MAGDDTCASFHGVERCKNSWPLPKGPRPVRVAKGRLIDGRYRQEGHHKTLAEKGKDGQPCEAGTTTVSQAAELQARALNRACLHCPLRIRIRIRTQVHHHHHHRFTGILIIHHPPVILLTFRLLDSKSHREGEP